MKTAFTLIEILIVVILLGVLAAIVVPQFSEGKADAEESACKTNQKSILTAVSVYKLKESADPTAIGDLAPTYLPEVPRCGTTAFTSLAGACPVTGSGH